MSILCFKNVSGRFHKIPEDTFQKRFFETILKPSDFEKFRDSKSPNTNTDSEIFQRVQKDWIFTIPG